MTSNAKKVPPDGGYGWVVTFAYALNNIVVLPLIANFALVFEAAIVNTGLSHTQGNLVIILNHGIGMLLSFFGGPVLKRFGYRKVAVTGAILISVGLMITAVSSSFWMFILSYSIINSMGVAAVMAAFGLAINSFFKEKRGRAIGVAMSITGLGGIGTPLVMSALMYALGWRYTVLTLAAICLHSLVAACLLRPAKWYLKDPALTEEEEPLNKDPTTELVNGSVSNSSKVTNNVQTLSKDEETIGNGVKSPPKSISMRSLASATSLETRNAVSHPDVRKKTTEPPLEEARYKWWESQEINLGSSYNIFHESELTKKIENFKEKVESTKEEEINQTFLQKFINFFDLSLIADPVFVNILVGMSVAACVETNFTLLLPIILQDMMQFDTSGASKIMSILAFSDTIFRLISPFIGEWCHKPPRVMYMISLVLTASVRTIMLSSSSFMGMVFVAIAMGFAKGLRTVYMNIVIPSYVPIERLAFASGIQMFVNGITIIMLGTLLGQLRQSSGSYYIPILVLNAITLFTVLIWGAEFLFFKINANKKDPEEQIV